MTVLLALVTIASWGSWIPLAQAFPGVSQEARVFYVTLGNIVVATLALLIGGGSISFGWKPFWLPVLGGVVWVGGNYTAFRAAVTMGIARANGTWAPLNIIVSFIWGALLFGELGHTSTWRLAVLFPSLALVVAGVLLIVGTQAPALGPAGVAARSAQGTAFIFAALAGVLWGSYFIPAQWAGVPAQVANLPLALGMLGAGAALAWSGSRPVRLAPRATGAQLLAGGLFGVGQIALLALVARVGTGVGFTLAQLSLLVTAGLGIFVFKVPKPGSVAAHRAIAGILLAGAGGVAIGALK